MTASQLVPVVPGTIGTIQCLTVDGRALHGVLGVRRDFSTWMKSRITKYGFVEGQDYEKIVNNFILPKTGEASCNGLQAVAIEYTCALDMGKELCMVENNEKGRIARRYFIECERQLLTEQPALDSTLTPAQQSDLHNILAAKIGMLPKEQQGGAWPQAWERLKRHFKVAKYEQIPQSRYGEAVTYLIGMEIKPKALTRPEALPLPPTRSAKALARDNWLKAHSDFYSYQNAVSQPRTWLEGETRALKRHCGYATTENTALEVIEYLLALRVYLDGAITSAVSVARNLTA